MRYREEIIAAHYAGFGMYEQGGNAPYDWDDQDDLLAQMRDGLPAELYELGRDELPPPLEDIRGRIHNQSGRIFGWIEEGPDGSPEAHYCAISGIE